MAQILIPTHSEPDAVLKIIGGIHMEGQRLMVGDTAVIDKLAAQLGITRGGSRMVYFECTITAITTETVESDPTGGGAFAEKSEPQPPPA